MPSVSVAFAQSLAPAASACDNAMSLVKKKSYLNLGRSTDETLIFGECQGSGKEPYRVSVDLIHPDKPVLRCSCPSRQFPCKHSLGLLLAYAGGEKFPEAPAPGDLLEKREKSEQREKKAAEKASSPEEPGPKKVNLGALKKKIQTQMEGLESLGAEVLRIGVTGIGALTPETLEALEERAKRLGDAYLPGPQVLLRRFISQVENQEDKTPGVATLGLLRTLGRKGLEHLKTRLDDPEHKLDPESTMDEWLGHAWQLSELAAAGLVRKDVSLVQLSFTMYTDEVKQEFCDSGLWCDLETGRVFETRNLRPFRAVKHIKAEDSFFPLAQIPELCVYPGGINPRVRWDRMTDRPVSDQDRAKILSLANPSSEDMVKQVKGQLKNALLPGNPVLLLRFKALGRVGAETVIEDMTGGRLFIMDSGNYPTPTTDLLEILPAKRLENGAALLRFDLAEGRLSAQILTLIHQDAISRLGW